MDTTRPLSQIGQENPCAPYSASEDELFDSLFDWKSYCDSTKPDSPFTSHVNPKELSRLITEIPHFIDNLSLSRLDAEYYAMKAPFTPIEESATRSDFSGQTPPELIRGGSTSPSDHSGSLLLEHAEEARRRPEVSLREVQAQDDEWTYPQTDPRKQAPRGYPPQLQVQEGYRRSLDQGAGLKRRRSGNVLDKKQKRQLSDPDQTADVRKSGACLPCRVAKTRCQESGVCPACRKAFPSHSHIVCTRMTPAMTWPVIGRMPDVWSVNAAEEEQLRLESRFFAGKPREIFVYFTRDTALSALRATVQAYRSQDGSEEHPRKAAFPREKVPSHFELQKWVEQQIMFETGNDFRHLVQNFLLAYSEEGHGLPKHNFVEKVHKMHCFFRIWRTPSFYCRDPTNKLVTLPLSVQAELRSIAREALKSLEHDVFKLLDDCIAQQGPLKEPDRMAIWASMWQLMFMYRDLLVAFKKHLTRMRGIIDLNQERLRTNDYRELCDKIFPMIIVFYHYLFRTSKSLELSLEWLKAPTYPTRACQSKRIRHFAKDLLASRKQMFEKTQQSEDEIDRMLCLYVVNYELKKLTTKRRTPKNAKSS